MRLIFLGTGGAWSLPELNCSCRICREMRLRKESRRRTSLLFSGQTNLLIDCGPDIASQLSDHQIERLDGILITHEHGDHYIGLDELVSYKRTSPRGAFAPIPVYMTKQSWEVIKARFGYLVDMEVIRVREVEPLKPYTLHEFEIMPFKTNHGAFAAGSVGYIVQSKDREGKTHRLIYTSDFVDLPESPPALLQPDVLIIQSFWLNEPVKNIPQHMSFQRALDYIQAMDPKNGTFLVHIGDGDPIPDDPANRMLKKREPADPMRSPESGEPYPVPMSQEQWQKIVDQILSDRGLPYHVTVAYDGLRIKV